MGMVDFKRGQQHTALGKRLEEERMRSAAGGASSKAMRLQTAQKSLGKKMQAGSMASSAPVQGLTSQGAGSAMGSTGGAGGMGAAGGAAMAGNVAGDMIDEGGTTTSSGAGAAGGAAKGAAMGTMLLPGWGTAIGAVVGGVTGALKAKSNRRKAEAAAQAKMHRELGKIEGDKTERLNQALSGLASQFTATLV